MKLQERDLAPDFLGIDQDGVKHNLAKYEGEWVLLYFYPKDNTPGCVKEACSFRDLFNDFKNKLVILGISADSLESHKNFARRYHLPFPLISDKSKIIISSYETDGKTYPKRTSFLISPEGVIKKIYQNVKAETHAEEVLDDIELFGSEQE